MSLPNDTPYTLPSRDKILAASQRRAQTIPLEATNDKEHDLRQFFRHLLDPGILRGVERKTALASMRTLFTLADNLLKKPDNEKFKQFKPTNTLIKRNLVDVKGALEYAVEMGFRADIQKFQAYYVFNPRKTTELRIGAAILKEALERETEKEMQAIQSRMQEKAALDLRVKQVKLAFEDDRRQKALHDKLERERRETRELAAAAEVAAAPSSPSSNRNASPSGINNQVGKIVSSPPPHEDLDPYFE